eukprot:7218641-Ditylum_brightwellii.AAC.1
MFHCQHDDAIALQTLALTKFRSKLIKQKTASVIKQVLYYKLTQWCKLPALMPPLIPRDAAGDSVREALEEQSEL